MPVRLRIDRGYTIGPNETQQWNWNWFGDSPNRGPVIFAADPKNTGSSSPHVRELLVTYDTAKCRGGQGDSHEPEEFYEFKIRNDNNVTVPFSLEIILFNDLPLHQFT